MPRSTLVERGFYFVLTNKQSGSIIPIEGIGMKNNCDPKKIILQLHRIEGQVRAIEKMYNDKRDIEEIVRVVQAARSSLDSVTRLLVNDKVSGCYDGNRVVKKQELLKLVEVLFKNT